MQSQRDAFKAGLFILISIALIIGVIVAIKGVGRLLERQQVRVARFDLKDDIGGLRVGDDVRVGGLKVGIVRDLEIEEPAGPTTQPVILVTFHMPKRLVLREGARIGVQNTVTGTSWLNFDNLGAGTALADGAVLQGRPGSMTQILSAANELALQLTGMVNDLRNVTIPKVNKAVDHAGGLAGDVRTRLDDIIKRYNTVADRAADVMVHLGDIFGQGKGDIRGTLANLNAATGTLKEKLPPVMEKLDGALARANTSLDNAQQSLKDLQATLANAKEFTGQVRSILASNRSRIDELVASAKEAGDNLKFATAEIRRSPWRLLYKPRPNEMANLNLFDAARSFAEGANDMSDAATALRDALKDPHSQPQTIHKLVEQLDQSFGQFKTVEDQLWEKVKE
ncbi:MAG: MlaD family protein [Tepidisphaeraceae bacterium]